MAGLLSPALALPPVSAAKCGRRNASAFVRNDRRDILAANHLGRALYAQIHEDPIQPPNTARFIFLDARARGFYHDWDRAANTVVAMLRTASGKHPDDHRLDGLINHLAKHSDDFQRSIHPAGAARDQPRVAASNATQRG
jgi:hypothetical protein